MQGRNRAVRVFTKVKEGFKKHFTWKRVMILKGMVGLVVLGLQFSGVI